MLPLDKLESVEKRYEDITRELSDPKTVNNPEKVSKLSKELSQLEDIVKLFREYKSILSRIEEAKTILKEEKDEDLKNLAKEELSELEPRLEEVTEKLKLALIPKDPLDEKNIFLEIRAGTGGEEAALFAAELFRMYAKYAERKGWKVEIMDSHPTGLGGFKEIIAQIKGKGVYSRLKYESGVHRVQRVPETESQGRIHTSAVTVAILPEPDEMEVEIRPEDLKIEVFRASGHGGQHVNRTESAVRITHIPTGIVVSCQDERSQHQNKAKAMKILRARLYEKMRREQEEKIREERRSQIGSGDRSEKIRTYNFPQSRVTDHRIGLTLYRLSEILEGDLDQVIDPLIAHFQAKALGSNPES